MKSKNIEYQEKIDHLRFLAASLVVMFHSVVTHFLWKPLGTGQVIVNPLYDVLLEGHTAVGLFMTLSGFLFAVICKGKEISTLGFYRNRFLRIYPLFTVFILLACYLDPEKNGLTNLLTSLFFLQNAQCAVNHKWFTEVLWTIAVEFQFYLLFPFLLIFFRKYGYKYLLGLVSLAFLFRFAMYIAQGTVKTLAYLTIFGRIDQFLIGMMLGFAFDRLRSRLSNPLILVLSILPVMLAASHFHKFGGLDESRNSYVWIYWPTLEALAWGVLIVAYNASKFKIPQPVSTWLAFAGSLSFSMYMSHYFLLRTSRWFIWSIFFPDEQYRWLLPLVGQLRIHPFTASLVFGSCVVFPLTLFISVLTYLLIEKPFLELRSTYTSPTPKPTEVLGTLVKVPVSVG